MPYIAPDLRSVVRKGGPDNPGELSFALTDIIIKYMEKRGVYFGIFAEVLGAIEATKLELYRRKIAPYEDKKLEVNGDVY